MKKINRNEQHGKRTFFTLVFSVVMVFAVMATPSTVFWTPATTYIQPYLKGHITYDSYVRDTSAFPNDYGFTVGVLPFSQVQAEIGYDTLLPVGTTFKDSQYLTAKIGTPENSLLPVGISAGVFNLGLSYNVTNQNVWHAEISKTLDYVGTLCVGGYSGNNTLLKNDDGESDSSGFMASWTSPQIGKFIFIADYMSGNNALSAWGIGATAYFADNCSLITGPVFPLSKQFAGSDNMLWTLQLDIDFDMMPPAPAAK